MAHLVRVRQAQFVDVAVANDGPSAVLDDALGTVLEVVAATGVVLAVLGHRVVHHDLERRHQMCGGCDRVPTTPMVQPPQFNGLYASYGGGTVSIAARGWSRTQVSRAAESRLGQPYLFSPRSAAGDSSYLPRASSIIQSM